MNTPIIDKKEADKKDFLVVRNKRTLDVVKVVAPHEFQIGVDEYQQANLCLKGDQDIFGKLVIKGGCTGALKLPGKDTGFAIKEGTGIKITDNRNDTLSLSIDPAYLDSRALNIEPLPGGGILTSSVGNKLLLSIDESFIPQLPTFVGGEGISILTGSGTVEISLSNQRGITSQTNTELVMNANFYGIQNGVNRVFTLDHEPVRSSFMMWFNGQLLTQDFDYELSGNTVTVLGPVPPDEDDVMKALYSRSIASKFYALNVQPQLVSIGNAGAEVQLQYDPDPAQSLMIFLNGQLLTEGNSHDYILSGKNVSISKKVMNDDIIRVTYSYST